MWSAQLRREFNPPSAPRAPAKKPAPITLSAQGKVHAAPPPAPPAKRAPHADPSAQSDDQSTIVFLKGGVELPNGEQSLVGDRMTMATAQAGSYVLRGAADYVKDGAA